MTKILYVDDIDFCDGMLERRLIRRGFNCIRARDGAQAIKIAHVEMPDLILMDLAMPVMDGWEATKRIKASDQTKHIPIIALSALVSMIEEKAEAFAVGCDDCQEKPIELPLLLEKMNRLLSH